MIILDGEKLRAFWDSLAEGLEKDPVEVIIWLILVIALIIIPVLLYVIRRIIFKRRQLKLENTRFSEIITKRKLTVEELNIIDKFKTGFKRNKITDILTNSVAFNSCARKYMEYTNSDGRQLAGLRIKLGLEKTAIKSPIHSTAELYPNLKVKVHAGKLGTFRTTIKKVDDQNIEIKSANELRKDRNVIMEIERDSGCYLIHTSVSGYENGIVKLNHSEKIEHIQNREYHRKKVKLPVVLKKADKKYNSYSIDIGGGGAKIKNPGFTSPCNDEIIIGFILNKTDRFFIRSRIERITNDNSCISIRFEKIREADRDRIMRFVLK